MEITLDTNVLISGTFWTGDSFKILKLIAANKLDCVLSRGILEEYARVASSDEITDKVSDKNLVALEAIKSVMQRAVIVVPTRKLNVVLDDPDDNKIIECAIEGGVDYIITQDKHLLKLKRFENIEIVTPREFLDLFKA